LNHIAPPIEGGGGDAFLLAGLFEEPTSFEKREFVPFRPGVEISPLYGLDREGRFLSPSLPAPAFLRYAPGASGPFHHHPAYEHIHILRGSQRDDRGTYVRGTCLISLPGSRHRVTSDDGCLVLAFWNQPVVVEESTQPLEVSV
jgi:hypothetical protein